MPLGKRSVVRTVRDERYTTTIPDRTEIAVKEKSRNMALRPVMKNTAMPAKTCSTLMTIPTIRALRSSSFWVGISGPSLLHGMSALARTSWFGAHGSLRISGVQRFSKQRKYSKKHRILYGFHGIGSTRLASPRADGTAFAV